MRYYLLFVLLFILMNSSSSGQEFKAQVRIIDTKIQTVDKKVFRTLEQTLTNFINDRQWTNIAFKPFEKINCNFIITIDEVLDDKKTIFKSRLNISANRPIFNATYSSPIINHVDNNFTFKYVELQQIQFNEQQINLGDGLVDNLSAEIAYYLYLTTGLYLNSLEENSGKLYFEKARNIVNNAPKGETISGWDASGNRKGSRYWLLDDLMSPRMSSFQNLWYQYHRSYMDHKADDNNSHNNELTDLVNEIQKLYSLNASSNLIEFLMSTKGSEIYELISTSNLSNMKELAGIMTRINIAKSRDYQKLINGQ